MSDVIIEKYMTEIKTYPNGKKFIRSWFVNKELKSTGTKAKPVKTSTGKLLKNRNI